MNTPLKDKIMASILSGRNTEAQLISLYRKLEPGKFSPSDHNDIVRALEKQLRDRFPRAANRVFGAKDKDVVESLELFVALLDFDPTTNKLGNHVKTGGGRIRGECYIQNYISYKNQQGQKVELLLEQKTFESELMAYVYDRSSKGAEVSITSYTYAEIDEAKQHYNRVLQRYCDKN
ncbi:hypothetical protein [Photobacterium leiognathi]|uniref:hypothetical protein n=2 Tax=Photobacterium leiognathi TaxID=553611 RepID=UPI002736C014|nr:hypothetical protein [Photobacterium leiognathi]